MGLLTKARTTIALNRKAEEALYEMALDEYEAGDIRRGLWAQALAEASGEESRAKGLYLKLRVRAMQDDSAIVSEVLRRESVGVLADQPPQNAAPAVEPPKKATAAVEGLRFVLHVVALVLVVFLVVTVFQKNV